MKVELGEIKEERNDASKRLVWKIAAGLIAAVLVAGCAFAAAKGMYENKKTVEYVEVPVEKEKIVEVPVETKAIITGEIMQEKLRDIGELASEEYNYTEVATFDKSMSTQLFGYDVTVPFTQSKFIYTYQGMIKAGVDFERLTVEKDEESRRITVTLPKARILSSEIDLDSFNLYDEKNSIFNPISVKDVNATDRMLKENAEEKAVKEGLLQRADTHARTMIRSLLLSAFDVGEYMIQVKTV